MVENGSLNGCIFAALQTLEQHVRRKAILERLRPERLQQRVLVRVTGDPQQATEAARVVEAQAAAAVEHEVVVIVREQRCVAPQYAQAPRHPEVGDERALLEFDQQVLRAPAHVAHPLARQDLHEGRLDGPAQARLAQHQGGDAPAAQGTADAAAGGLDFRQLGHGSDGMVSGGRG